MVLTGMTILKFLHLEMVFLYSSKIVTMTKIEITSDIQSLDNETKVWDALLGIKRSPRLSLLGLFKKWIMIWY